MWAFSKSNKLLFLEKVIYQKERKDRKWKEWEKEVGITDEDKQFKKRIIEIAISGMKLTEDNLRGN